MNTDTKTLRQSLVAALVGAALLLPATAFAGKGASYTTIKRAIATNNRDSIVAEIERAEKLPCAPCMDLVLPLIDHANPDVRDVAAWWLSKRAARTAVRDDMFERLTGTDSTAARNAAEVLGRFMHPDALMPLELAIHDDSLSDEARAAAAVAVGSIGDYRGKAVLEAALTSESAAVRAAAAKGLRNIRGNVDAIAVVELLSDDDDTVIMEAVLTLGAVREVGAAADLGDIVTDTTLPVAVRKHAAWAMGRTGGDVAVLRAVADDDPSMLVRGAARAALQSLK
ncbi:MAG TPA: HEAT repeat domain-containing protein [Nannocystaceae bacterium]|nr:HEAT repeat domain-containing protein [Nannocystaceae bacterium]